MLRTGELQLAENLPPNGCSPAVAQAYTRWLSTHHYENFNVASWLLPKDLHQHFYNLYAYCRWADDLGDEIPSGDRALELLNWWEAELNACYEGRPSHPVFVALRETIDAKDVPREPFADLLKAFRQDQAVKRYPTWDSVNNYCVYSANPVGRLVLYLCGYRDERRQKLSDATCTALQLANFWQDVSRDLEIGRIYIPLDRAKFHGVSEKDIVEKNFDGRYIALMKDLIARTRELFHQGLPLAKLVEGKLAIDLEMFSRGGIAVLDSIEKMGYDTLHNRPSVSKGKQVRLLGRAVVTHVLGGSSAAPEIAKPISGPQAGHSGVKLDVAASYQECHRIAREAHSNFYPAFFLLPKSKRDGIVALYAFMRLIDDVSDEGADLAAKQRGLAKWRAALDEGLTGEAQFLERAASDHGSTGLMTGDYGGSAGSSAMATTGGAGLVLPALVDTIRRFKMPPRYLHDLISGAEMDLTEHSYGSYDRLREYCYRVAGTVGLTCTHIFGFSDPRALDLSEKLGLAFQLTNIIRDIKEDYAMGRTYLPDEDLARYGVSKDELSAGEATLGVRELLRFEADRAWKCYEDGAELLNLIDEDSRSTLWLLAHTYSALLARIESLDFAVFGERVRLTKAEKMMLIAKARFGRHTEANILAKRNRDRRGTGRTVGGRRAG